MPRPKNLPPSQRVRITDTLRLLKTWWVFPHLRTYQWQSSPSYWRLKRGKELLAFHFKKRRFKARSLLRGSVESTSIFGQVIRVIFWRLVFSVVLVFAFFLLDRLLLGWRPAWIPNWLHLSLQKDAQRDFLTTLGSVAAAFLALYFTAMSVVISTAYARTPGNIRSLIIREEVGSVYFRILAQFAGVVTVMLAALAFGYQIGVLNTSFAAFLCLFSIFGFVVLGARSFEYLDPTALVGLLNRQILREIQAVTPGGYQWMDQSFQGHHHRQVEQLLGSYSDLVTIASEKENVHSKGLIELGRGLMVVVDLYAKEKVRIPSSSFWFRRTYRHKNWLLTSYHELEIALLTGTIVQPESVPDLNWLESDAGRIISRIFEQLIERTESANITVLADSLQNYVGGISRCLAVSEALQIFKAIAPILRSYISRQQIGTTEDTTEPAERLAITELYAFALLNLLLSFSNQLERLDPVSLGAIIESVDWLKRETLYTGVVLPRKVIEEIEFVRDRLEFEFRIEGKIVSPFWLQKEMAALGYVRFLAEATSAILEGVEITFGNEIRQQLAQNNYVVVAQFVQRGLEACTKLSNHFAKFESSHNEYVLLNRSGEYEWPKIDWNEFQKRIASLREGLVTALAESSAALATLPLLESWHDFFGHSSTVRSEDCCTAMADGREELFRVVFPAFFKLALEGNERLRQKFLSDARNIQLSIEPLADLMALSGYAAVFSKLDNKNFWELVEYCWNQYFALFAEDSQKRRVIQLLCLAVEPTLRIAPRSVMRTRWQQMCEGVFVARGLASERDFWRGARDSEPKHPSALVRIFSRSRYLFNDPCVVFLAFYAFKRPEAASLEKPRRVISLERDLQRSTENDLDE